MGFPDSFLSREPKAFNVFVVIQREILCLQNVISSNTILLDKHVFKAITLENILQMSRIQILPK